MRILGIETSCDETGIAIYDEKNGLLANNVLSQAQLHSNYGGVIPELAARDHVHAIIPLILSTLKQTNSKPNQINGIAYTAGPGLKSALLVGATIAQSLAYAWNIPTIDIHHMEAHLLAPMLNTKNINSIIKFPFISLLVSGGHTQLILTEKIGKYKILGESIDDAVGEVFDKIAVLLGLKYPGGSLLSKIAQNGIPNRYTFPRPMIHQPNLNFSFSGLKTAVARTIISNPNDNQTKADIAYAFERAVVDTLTIKCFNALKQTNIKYLIVSGGVSSNKSLRLNLSQMIYSIKGKILFPKLEFCTDNGAMVAYAGLIRFKSGLFNNNLSILVKPRWSLEDLPQIITKSIST